MKDIIAAQRIQRRKKPSLLSRADGYRIVAEKTFIKSRHSGTVRRTYNQKIPGDNPLFKAGSALAGFALLLVKIPRKVFFLLLGLCTLAGLALIGRLSYIPDPEPPEDALVREAMAGYSGLGPAADQGDEIPLDLTETFAWQNYLVRPGDSVELIARHFGLSLDAVIASNNLRNVRRELRAGERIRIPNMDGIPYTVKSGDSYAGIARSMDVPLEAVLDANDIQSDAVSPGTVLFIPGAKMDRNELRQALGELFVYPVSGRRTSPFGWRVDPFTGVKSFHAGLDLSSPMGTSVKASADGRVSAVGTNAVYGNFIILSHADNYQTMYAHLSRILVQKGASVSQGAVIGRVGSTGRSTGPHLHFSVYKNNRAVDPLEVLNK
jgi:murein DD-endopeptidase MepM/ murein hydrolase activator NlpD